ncbi:MAG: GNAT family N-acetyltransferase [Spirochaetales bacterium]|nr:GNAT family N-acetyltransferase [Spirochaetales bacterium]
MDIEYKKNIPLQKKDVISLFSSVEWRSQEYPGDLMSGLKNSDCVYTAWEDSLLVGLINALSDRHMVVYFHFVLVRPDYQHKGIGQKLVTLMLKEYKKVHTKILMAYNRKVRFYKKAGFKKVGYAKPMILTDMADAGE